MYKQFPPKGTSIRKYEVTEGETIEQMMRRIQHNNEPIEANKTIGRVYHERREGVTPETNIRSDAFDLALEGAEIAVGAHVKKREERQSKGENKTDGENSPS